MSGVAVLLLGAATALAAGAADFTDPIRLPAQYPRAPEFTNWVAANQKLQEKVNAAPLPEITPARVAADLHLPYPPPDPDVSPEAARAECQAQLAAETAGTAVTQAESALTAQAAGKYPLCRIGEKVTFTDARGQTVAGTLYAVGPNHVRIGSRNVPCVDVPPDVLVTLDPAANSEARDTFMAAERKRTHNQASTERDELARDIEHDVMRKHGFELSPGRQAWVTRKTILEDEVAARRLACRAKTREQLAPGLYAGSGLAETVGAWMPPAMAQAVAACETRAAWCQDLIQRHDLEWRKRDAEKSMLNIRRDAAGEKHQALAAKAERLRTKSGAVQVGDDVVLIRNRTRESLAEMADVIRGIDARVTQLDGDLAFILERIRAVERYRDEVADYRIALVRCAHAHNRVELPGWQPLRALPPAPVPPEWLTAILAGRKTPTADLPPLTPAPGRRLQW